jgi:hypothetical protein
LLKIFCGLLLTLFGDVVNIERLLANEMIEKLVWRRIHLFQLGDQLIIGFFGT